MCIYGRSRRRDENLLLVMSTWKGRTHQRARSLWEGRMGMSCRSHDEELLLHSGKIKPSLSSIEGFVVVRDDDQSTPHRRRQHQHRRIAVQTTTATTTGSSTGHVDQLQHQHQAKHQGIRATEDAPHCMTCYCLSNKMKCNYRRTTCAAAVAAATVDLERCTEPENLSLEALNYNKGDYPDCSSKLTVEGSESNTDRQKPFSTRKRLVEELLREMQLNSRELDDDQLTRTCAGGDMIDGQWNCRKNQDEETGRTSGSRQPRQQQRRPRRRPSGAGSYRSISTVRHKPKAAETSDLSATANEMTTYSPIRSCERFPVEERKCDTYDKDKLFGPSGITVPEIEDIGTDNTVENKASRDPASSPYRLSHPTDKWQQQQQQQQQQQRRSNGNSSRKNTTSEAAQALHDLDVLHVPGRNNGQGDNTADRLTLPDKDESEESDDGGFTRRSRSHVRELKLVRWEFIERIYDEVRRLHRLQKHLDDCSPRRCVTHTKSVSTMTSGRGIRGDTDTLMLGDDALRGN